MNINPSAPRPERGQSLLLISFVEWAGAFQRPQHLAMGLARRGWRVTYAAPGYLHRRGRRVASGLMLPEGLTVLEPPALPGAGRLAAIQNMNGWLMRRGILAHGTNAEGSPTDGRWDVVIYNDPRWAAVAASLPARRRVFDCMDDLSASAPSAAWAALEARALATADRVWTGTASLADRLTMQLAHEQAERRPPVRFIPCGVEAERFATPDLAQVEAARADLPPATGPLAGYFGVLNERFDMRLVEALLAAKGCWRVLLIGPATSRAPALPRGERIRWIGARPYAQLPAYLTHFDLALIPYDNHGPHRFLYPVKAMEYLAGGKPVLSTPLPDVARFLGDYVELAESPAEWRAAAERLAVETDPAREQANAKARSGSKYARSRSWAAMLDEMEEELA